MVIRRYPPSVWHHALNVLLLLPLLIAGGWYLQLPSRLGVPLPLLPTTLPADWQPEGPELEAVKLPAVAGVESAAGDGRVRTAQATIHMSWHGGLWIPHDHTAPTAPLAVFSVPSTTYGYLLSANASQCYAFTGEEGTKGLLCTIRESPAGSVEVVCEFEVSPPAGRRFSSAHDCIALPNGDVALLFSSSLGEDSEFHIQCWTNEDGAWKLRWPEITWRRAEKKESGVRYSPRLRHMGTRLELVEVFAHAQPLLSVDAASGDPVASGPPTRGPAPTSRPTPPPGYLFSETVHTVQGDEELALIRQTRYARMPYGLWSNSSFRERLTHLEARLRLERWQQLAPERGFRARETLHESIGWELYLGPEQPPLTLPEQLLPSFNLEVPDSRRRPQFSLTALDESQLVLASMWLPEILPETARPATPGLVMTLTRIDRTTGEIRPLGWTHWPDAATDFGAEFRFYQPIATLTDTSLLVILPCYRVGANPEKWFRIQQFERSALGL